MTQATTNDPSQSPSTPPSLVQYRVEHGVAVLTLSNPPANTYSYEMMQALDQAILRARFDDEAHVLLVTGGGERFFCAGADIAMLDRMGPSYKYNFCLHANETLLRLEQTPKLVIAAINGHCVGGGLEVAMAADLRVAPAEATFKLGHRRRQALHLVACGRIVMRVAVGVAVAEFLHQLGRRIAQMHRHRPRAVLLHEGGFTCTCAPIGGDQRLISLAF